MRGSEDFLGGGIGWRGGRQVGCGLGWGGKLLVENRGEDRDEGVAEERTDAGEWTEFGWIVKEKFEGSDVEEGDGGGAGTAKTLVWKSMAEMRERVRKVVRGVKLGRWKNEWAGGAMEERWTWKSLAGRGITVKNSRARGISGEMRVW